MKNEVITEVLLMSFSKSRIIVKTTSGMNTEMDSGIMSSEISMSEIFSEYRYRRGYRLNIIGCNRYLIRLIIFLAMIDWLQLEFNIAALWKCRLKGNYA